MSNPAMFPKVSPILPMGGRAPTVLTGGTPPIYMRLQYLLPTFVLATGGIAGYSRYMRASMLDVIGQISVPQRQKDYPCGKCGLNTAHEML